VQKAGEAMSCDYAVWRTPARLTNDEAARVYETLCSGDTSAVAPSPGIAAFCAELRALHPEPDDVPEDRLDDHDYSPWSMAFERSEGHLILSCVWSKAEYVGELVRRLARKHGLACFDPQTGTVAYPDVLVLRAEGQRNRHSPSPADIETVVARMASGKGPSFAILEGRGDDYAQAAGGTSGFTVEWREHSGRAFRHWKAGSFGHPAGEETLLGVAGRDVHVEPGERLSAADVVAILEAYLKGEPRPERWSWRDMTDTFPR
jgi:hypothetical protein